LNFVQLLYLHDDVVVVDVVSKYLQRICRALFINLRIICLPVLVRVIVEADVADTDAKK